MRRTVFRSSIVSSIVGAVAAVAVAGAAFAADPRGMDRDDDRHWFGMLIILAIAAAAVVALVFALRNRSGTPVVPVVPGTHPASPTAGAEALLAERLARGEISPDDYRTTLAALRGDPGPSATATQ